MSVIQGNNPYIQPSFSIKNRVSRAVWQMVWLFFFRLSPRPFHAWRSFLLRIFGAQIGKHVHIYPSVKVWAPWNLRLGNFVGIGDGANLYSMGEICIGNYTTVSQGVHLCSGSHDFNSENFQLYTAKIFIEDRVWLCTEAFVCPGVTIAQGSVVGARGVVSKSISEPWKVWAGVPVRSVGTRKIFNNPGLQ